MSSSVSNKVPPENLAGDDAVAKRPANDDAAAKTPANNGAVLRSPANDEAAGMSAPQDNDESAPDTDEILPIEGVGGGRGGGGGVSLPVTIAVTMSGIRYDEELSERAGFLKMDADDPPLSSSDGGTVLRLLYYLVYTKEGRGRLLEYTFDRDANGHLRAGETRAELKALLQRRFPDLEDLRLEIALDAHFAASEYVTVVGKDNGRAGVLQEIYRQKLAAMLGALYDDSMGRDFSCLW